MLDDLSNWQFLIVSGFVLIFLEIITFKMIFLNMALASFITAGVSLFVADVDMLMVLWGSVGLLGFLASIQFNRGTAEKNQEQ